MKIWEVRFKKKSARPILVEAAKHCVAEDRATLKFYDDAGNVTRSFAVSTVKEVNLFSDPEAPLCSVF